MRELGVYIELSGNSQKKLSSFLLGNLQNNLLVLRPRLSRGYQAQGVNVSKKNIIK
jgi:hypothetical protein